VKSGGGSFTPLLLQFSLLAPLYLGVLFIWLLLWLWCLFHLLVVLALVFFSKKYALTFDFLGVA
jgi:hypothetical protein